QDQGPPQQVQLAGQLVPLSDDLADAAREIGHTVHHDRALEVPGARRGAGLDLRQLGGRAHPARMAAPVSTARPVHSQHSLSRILWIFSRRSRATRFWPPTLV